VALIERRIGLLFALFAILLGLAAARAVWVGAIKGETLRRAAVTQQMSDVPLPASRGTITDRRGVQLAVSEAAADVAANPYLIKDPLRMARRVAPFLGQGVPQVLTKLSERRKGFVYLARQLSAARAKKLADLHLEGIEVIPGSRRTYPQKWLAAQLLGTVGTEGVGLSGLEYAQDRRLGGRDGRREVVKDALGQPISLRDVKPPRAGQDVQLTIEAPIQDKVEEVLAKVGQKFSPKGATALVMDPRDGSILALGNWPRVNANDVAGSPAYARQNRAVAAAYEPGSTFKAFTVAGALEDRRVTPETSFDLPPEIQVADRTIGEAHERGPITLTTSQILAQSSNVGAITIGLREGKARFSSWVRAFGFGQATRVDLPGEERGIVPPPKEYSGSSMGNLPIGQGLSVTPIQMATGYAAIANGGILRPPRVVRSVGGVRMAESRGRRVLSAASANSVSRMLEGVLAPDGTGGEAAIEGYDLAGKTGTANKPDPATGEYSDTKFFASFVGFAPARRPRLLVAVMVDEPQGGIYGGEVAAPAFQEITAFALPYLRIPPD